MKTIYGGMDAQFAQDNNLPAQRTAINVYTQQGIKLLSKDRKNLINLYKDRSELETDVKKWQPACAALLPLLAGYDCVIVVENEPSMYPNYTPHLYILLVQATFTAMGSKYEILHGAWLLQQCYRAYAESEKSNTTLYSQLRSYGTQNGIWGKISQVNNLYSEVSYLKQCGLDKSIGMNFHWQQYAEPLPAVISFLSGLLPSASLSNNELSKDDINDSTVADLLTAADGKLKYMIWDNIKGLQGQIEPLSAGGIRILKSFA